VEPTGLDALHEVLDQLIGGDSFGLCDKASVVSLQRARAKLDYVAATVVAAFDAAGEWKSNGARTAEAWFSTRCHLPAAETRAQLRRGKALATLPRCAAAFSAGEIGAAQVDVLAKAAQGHPGVRRGTGPEGSGPDTAALFARDEALLVGHAKAMKFRSFVAAVEHWSQLADPDGADAADLARQARRDVYLVESFDDMYLGKMTLDPIAGTIVATELARLEQELFEADWKKAKEELGRDPALHELCRTPAQRRADALVEMAIRSASAPADGRRPEPLFSVLVGYETLYGRISRLEGGAVVSPGTLLPWLDGATFERIVFAPNKRVECSVRARFFTGGTRRAIEVRDQGCQHEFCEEPAKKCQADHIVEHAKGGLTTQENGRALCDGHNRMRNGREPPDGPDG